MITAAGIETGFAGRALIYRNGVILSAVSRLVLQAQRSLSFCVHTKFKKNEIRLLFFCCNLCQKKPLFFLTYSIFKAFKSSS